MPSAEPTKSAEPSLYPNTTSPDVYRRVMNISSTFPMLPEMACMNPAFYSLQLDDQVLVKATREIGYETISSFGTCAAAPSASPSQSMHSSHSSLVPTFTSPLMQTDRPTMEILTSPTPKPTLHPTKSPRSKLSYKLTARPTQATVTDAPHGNEPNANCPCNTITSKIRRALCVVDSIHDVVLS